MGPESVPRDLSIIKAEAKVLFVIIVTNTV